MTQPNEHTLETLASLNRQLTACREELALLRRQTTAVVTAVQEERDALRELCQWALGEPQEPSLRNALQAALETTP